MSILDPEKVLNLLQSKLLETLKKTNKSRYLVHTKWIDIWKKIIPSSFLILDPYCDFTIQAKSNNALLISDLTIDQIFYGNYKKYGAQNVDILPFGNLYLNEVKQLEHFCLTNQFIDYPQTMEEYFHRDYIYDLDANYHNYSPLLEIENPLNDKRWGYLTKDQKEKFVVLLAAYKKNSHKKIIGEKLICREDITR